MAGRNVITRLWGLVKALFSGVEGHNEPVRGNEGHSAQKRFPLPFNPEFRYRYPQELRDRAAELRESAESSASTDLPPMPERRPEDIWKDETATPNPDTIVRRFTPSAAEPGLSTLSGLKAERLRIAGEKRQEYRRTLSEIRAMADAHRYQEAETANRVILSRMDDDPEFRDLRSEVESNVQKIADEAQAWAEEERLRRLRQETSDAVQRMRSAAAEGRWADYAVEKRRVSDEILQTNAALKSLYDEAVGIYDAAQRELAERRERERIKREREAARREEEERRRIDTAKSKYIRKSIGYGSECICLYDYYPTRYRNISPDDDSIRKLIWNFKDGYGYARSYFCEKLSRCLTSIYGDSLSGMWFCTAQASTPTKAQLRYESFCMQLSNACGIKDGFGLISVVGVKGSAHSGSGTRGDISNLEVSDGVRGKRIVLLDDVCTSGATMNNLRKEILAKGAASVDCFALGSTV